MARTKPEYRVTCPDWQGRWNTNRAAVERQLEQVVEAGECGQTHTIEERQPDLSGPVVARRRPAR